MSMLASNPTVATNVIIPNVSIQTGIVKNEANNFLLILKPLSHTAV